MSSSDHRFDRITRAPWRIIVAAAALIALAGCTIPHLITFPFSATANANVSAPPAGGLLLWLEGDSGLLLDGAGRVNRWDDVRGDRSAVSQLGFKGSPVTATFTTPSGPRLHAGLRCAADGGRCAYSARDLRPGAPRLISLTGTPYSVLAVVTRRPGPRFNNYFLMTTGTGCLAGWGGTGCEANTVLHLGWNFDNLIRHGHYDFDVSSYVRQPAEEPVLMVAQSGPRGGLDVASLGAASPHSAFNSRVDVGPLRSSGELMVGGTPFWGPDGPDVPDWFFTGDIFAVLIYGRELTLAERVQASDYLRNKYGPR